MLHHPIFKRGAETQAVRQGDSPSLTAPTGGGSGLRMQTHSLGSWGPPLISASERLSVTWALPWSQVGGGNMRLCGEEGGGLAWPRLGVRVGASAAFPAAL